MGKAIYVARVDYENYGGFIIDGKRYYSYINKIIVDESYKIPEVDIDDYLIRAEFETYEDAANWTIRELQTHLEFQTNSINEAINTLKTRIKAYGKM